MDHTHSQRAGADIRNNPPAGGGSLHQEDTGPENYRHSAELPRAEHETTARKLVRVYSKRRRPVVTHKPGST